MIMISDKSAMFPINKAKDETIEAVNEFQCLGTMVTHKGNIHSEIKRRSVMTIKKL